VDNSKYFPTFAARLDELLSANWQGTGFDLLVNNADIGIKASFAGTTED
jgi:hypothetical protein